MLPVQDPAIPYYEAILFETDERSVIGIDSPEYSCMRFPVDQVGISLQRSEMNSIRTIIPETFQ